MLPLLEGLSPAEPGVVVLDSQGCVAWVSDGLGGGSESARSVLGRDWRGFVRHPERFEPLWERIRREGGFWDRSVEVETLDGRTLVVDVHAVRVSRSGRDAIVALVRRRDDRRVEEFRRSVHDLGAVLDCSPEPVVVVDREGRLQYANPAVHSVLGWQPESVLGRAADDFLVRPEDGERFTRVLDPPHAVLREELELLHGDGSPRWILLSASPLRAQDGGVVGAVVFLRDETERLGFKRSLERKNAELEQTARAISHDLRGPLVSVLGFSRLLREDHGPHLDDKGRHFLQRIEEAGRTMEALIRELLDFSRIGKPGERPPLVDPRQVLLQIEAELKTRLDRQRCRLELPAETPPVRCERARLYQIFANLVGNALEHMGERPDAEIRVEVEEQPEGWQLRVSDNGRGVDPAHHERIFDMFETVPRRDGNRGHGIGLAIVKKIAEVHGGRAWVESQPGEGARFHVLLSRR